MFIIRETLILLGEIGRNSRHCLLKLPLENIFAVVKPVNLWNALPDGIVGCKTINNFVNKLKYAELANFLTEYACL